MWLTQLVRLSDLSVLLGPLVRSMLMDDLIFPTLGVSSLQEGDLGAQESSSQDISVTSVVVWRV